jgi:hypothetical protein
VGRMVMRLKGDEEGRGTDIHRSRDGLRTSTKDANRNLNSVGTVSHIGAKVRLTQTQKGAMRVGWE